MEHASVQLMVFILCFSDDLGPSSSAAGFIGQDGRWAWGFLISQMNPGGLELACSPASVAGFDPDMSVSRAEN